MNLDPDLIEWIRAKAERRRCSMSQVVRDLIVEKIEKAPKPRRERK